MKNKKRVDLPKENFIKIENNHMPIISKEIFHKVQEINEKNKKIYYSVSKKKTLNKKDDSIFKGFIICGECGSKLYRVQKKYKGNTKKYKFFACKLHEYKKCNFISIKEEVIREVVFTELKKQIEIAINLNELVKKNLKVINFEETKINSELQKIKNEISKIRNFYKVIYEDYASGLLNEEDYIFTKNKYLNEENKLAQKQNDLESQLKNLKENLTKNNKYINQFLKFKNSKVLIRELIENLIKEIVIFKDKTIHIHFNYKTEYEILINKMENILKYAI